MAFVRCAALDVVPVGWEEENSLVTELEKQHFSGRSLTVSDGQGLNDIVCDELSELHHQQIVNRMRSVQIWK